MIALDKNYSISVNGTHGFELNYESDPEQKEVRTKNGTELRDITQKDTYYYPSLSKTLMKYYSLNVNIAANEKELLERVIKVENNISNFSKVYAKGGKIFQTK